MTKEPVVDYTVMTTLRRADSIRSIFFCIFIAIIFPACFDIPAKANDVSALKKKIAVNTLRTRENVRRFSRTEVETGLTGMLIEALLETGRFLVVERTALNETMDRYRRSSPGRNESHAAVQAGKTLGAQVILTGTITSFEPSTIGEEYRLRTYDDPLGLGLNLRLGLSNLKAEVEVQLMLIEAATGAVIVTFHSRGRSSSRGVTIDAYQPDMSYGSDLFFKRPIGGATRKAVRKAVSRIVTAMEDIPWSARVMEIIGNRTYINAGSLNGVKPGDRFAVFREEVELTDPETGVLVDVLNSKLGIVTVESVERRYSVATLSEGIMPERSDLVKRHDLRE